ncbi:3-hydroxyacyl-CoA dehydrogenase family protein [Sporomusa aerivorans]|uniref:3-hydroxyacyl-CoA dehydrogenase family protein n=1 Tax=Sporomusa aerivorans TaxID=204936 RepID=UPI00352BC779
MKASDIKKIACIGAGVIGAGWATNFAVRGYPVVIYDIMQAQLDAAKDTVKENLDFLVKKEIISSQSAATALAMVSYTLNLEEAVKNAQFIQESGPEKYEIKQKVLAEIEEYTRADTIIASSTSGLLITEIAKYAKHPERCIGGHPYNPPHLIPLVEITKGEQSSAETVHCAKEFYTLLGKEPVVLNKETLGFIANRLQMAISREIMDLVMRGVCTIEDVDKAMLYGPGLRFAIMGPILALHLGGGPQGAKGMLTKMREPGMMWLKDMASGTEIPEEWADIAHEGVLREMENRPAEFGKTDKELIKFRDDMLIELLKLHNKL